MSITKLGNGEHELISQKDIDSGKVSAKSSLCSCLTCDSLGCFEKRKKIVRDRCQCGFCKEIRKNTPCLDQRGLKDPENATKKVVREVVTRETIESLKRVTETMYEFGNDTNFEMFTNRQSKLNDKIEIPTPRKSQISIKIESSKKRPIGDSTIDSKDCCKQRPIVIAPSTDITEPRKESYTATKLSAQVMNVPYEDLHETVPSSQDITEQNPLSKLNIFRRIKEIYDACSCKVCECISSKPQEIRDDTCNCTPCQCQDCVKLRLKIEEKIKRLPHSGCPCIRCDRRDCRGISKNASEREPCDCDPNNDTQYPKNLARSCKCEPCQCIDCRFLDHRTSKTVKLGQVNAYIQRETCQCSPCECLECRQIYSRTNPTIMCTHASDRHKYGSFCRCHICMERCQFGMPEICKCDSRNIPLRKSFNTNFNDYDIRTVIVDNNGPFNQQKEGKFENHNTVTLFASLKNNYQSNSCAKGVCKCTECECIVCSAQENSLRSYRDRLKDNVMSLHNGIKLSTSIGNACKCTPCECEICTKKGEHEGSMPLDSKCRCDVCDCLNCDNASLATSSFPSSSTPHQSYSNHGRHLAKPIRSMNMNKNCNCNPCDCRNCKNLFSCSSSIKFYSDGKRVEKKVRRSRKVMLVTPSTSESNLKNRKTYIESVSSTNLSPKQSMESVFRQDLSTCHATSHNYAPGSHLLRSYNNAVFQLYEGGKENNVTSDDDVDGEMLFKLNNPVQDTTNIEYVDETPIVNPIKTCEKSNKEQEQSSEEKYKHFFNIIHEQPDKITCNGSDESLPVYWACCNATSYSRTNARNIKITCKKTKSGLKSLKNRLDKTKISKNKVDDLNERKENEFSEDNKFKKGDALIDSVINSYSEHCGNKGVNFSQESQKYIDCLHSSPKNKEYRKTTTNHSDISIDYERASRVLYEAKAFSSKLIKMLDSFETANKRFESASQKFKVLHESLLNINENELNKTYSTNLGRTPRPIFENTFTVISEASHDDKQSADETVRNENQAEREYEQSINKSEDICNDFQYTEELSKKYTSDNMNITNMVEKTVEIETQQNTEKETLNNCNLILNLGNSAQETVSDTNNLDSSATHYDDEFKNNVESKNSDNNKQKPIMASVAKKLDLVFSNNTTKNTSVATKEVEQNPVELSKQQENQTWQIFKKNLYIDPPPKDKKTIFQSPALELDIKEAIQAIALQSRNEKVLRRPNEALANLQSEVNDLLNMPLLQNTSKYKYKAEPKMHAFPRSKLDLEAKSFSSTASSQTYDRLITKADKEVYFNIHSEKSKASCDDLKATFTGLRRVSDHTVLVKWSVPRRLADVQGYELLVDGRAVQKIFSATRSMAVLTCLPAARVLLTVRTLVANGHAPASTIVYRPRNK